MRISSFRGLQKWLKSRGLWSTSSSSNSKRFKGKLAAEEWLALLAHPAWPHLEGVLYQTLEEAQNLPRPEDAGADWPLKWSYHLGKADACDEIYRKFALLTESAKKLLAD
jgi:hypothetical protein